MVQNAQGVSAAIKDNNARTAQQAGDERAAQKKKDLEAVQQAQARTTKTPEANTGLVNVVI